MASNYNLQTCAPCLLSPQVRLRHSYKPWQTSSADATTAGIGSRGGILRLPNQGVLWKPALDIVDVTLKPKPLDCR